MRLTVYMFYDKDLCVFVVLYVDDFLITRSHEKKVMEFYKDITQNVTEHR